MAETLPGPGSIAPQVLKAGGESSAELSGQKGYCLVSHNKALIQGDECAPR